jgi:hypothetical protein
MQVEDDNWLVYQIRISEMLKVIEIDNAKWVSDNRAIGLAHKNHRKLKRPLVHRDTSNIRSIARSLRRLSVRGSGGIEYAKLIHLEERMDKHVAGWRSCMGDPIAMAQREYGKGSIPPWLTGDDYIPEPLEGYDEYLDAQEAAYRAAARPWELEPEQEDSPAVENQATTVEAVPVEASAVEEEPATTAHVAEAILAPPAHQEPAKLSVTDTRIMCVMWEWAGHGVRKSIIGERTGMGTDRLSAALDGLVERQMVRARPPCDVVKEWSYALVA